MAILCFGYKKLHYGDKIEICGGFEKSGLVWVTSLYTADGSFDMASFSDEICLELSRYSSKISEKIVRMQ